METSARRNRHRILVHTLLLATAATAVFFAALGAWVASAWMDAKREENADLECSARMESRGAVDYRVRTQRGEYVCAYLDASGKTVREVRADTGISTGDEIAGDAFVAAVAGLSGGVMAFVALGCVWSVGRFAFGVGRRLRGTGEGGLV
jgi:hypothetical protein